MLRWDADAEVEQAYYFREQAGAARNIGEHDLANIFEEVARIAMVKAEIFSLSISSTNTLRDEPRNSTPNVTKRLNPRSI